MPGLQAPRRARPVAVEPTPAATAPPARGSARRIYVPLLITGGVVVALDQLTKQLALGRLGRGEQVDVIEGILRFRLVFNSGGAFGLLQGVPGLFLIATLGIIAGILIWAHKLENPRWAAPLGMVLGGGFGNALDRLVRDTDGAVVDFIDLHVWPVFNIADMSIVFGALAILLIGWKDSPEEAE